MYAKTSADIITRLSDGAQIPMDPANVDYQAYLAWVDEGNTPEEPEPPVPPPVHAVTQRQARLALHAAGLLAGVDAAIAAMPGEQGDVARIEWDHAASIERASPLVAAMGASLQMEDEALDALFRQAAAL